MLDVSSRAASAACPRELSTPAGIVSGAQARSPYIAGPIFDWFFFLAPPALALAIGALIAATHIDEERFWHAGRRIGYVEIAIGALIHAHLVAVFFRTHANPGVFRRYPVRFLAVPPALVLAMMASSVLTIAVSVLVVFWDVYHSALQTFGFARMYDRNGGNDASLGRRLDWWLNVLFYVGPIVAGASMAAHFGVLHDLNGAGISFFSIVPAFLETKQRYVAWVASIGGVGFVIYYICSYVRLQRRGYRVVWQKVWLLATTGVCSVITWSFNPWGQAFLIMNLFHAMQYLALVWWTEGPRMRRLLPIGRLTPVLFLSVVGVYGVWAELVRDDEQLLWSVIQVVALLHFWYDGFVWSVSKRHV